MASSPLPYAPNPPGPPVKRRPSLDFSLTGLIYCSMMMFMGLAAINSQANLLFGVFGLMIGILLISGVVSRKVLRRLKVRRLLPDHAMVGRPAVLVYQIANHKRFWPSLSVTVAELDGTAAFTRQPQAYMLHAAPGMTAACPTEVVPVRRGLHEFDRFQVSTSFPFGFIKRALTDRHRDHLLVYPPIGQVDAGLLQMCRAAEKIGSTMRPRRGGMDEFYGVKEHRPGDNPRHIHWRRSARTAPMGVLVAKELTQVAPPRVLLLVDTYSGSDAGPAGGGPAGSGPGGPGAAVAAADRDARIEKGIAMAASLAARALDEDLPVGLFVWSDGWKGIEPSRGKRHRNDVLSVLARLPPNTEHAAGELVARCDRFLRSGTTAVLVTPDDRPFGCDERGRHTILVIPVASAVADSSFRFEPGLTFTRRVPIDPPTTPGVPGTPPTGGRRVNVWYLAILIAFFGLVLFGTWVLRNSLTHPR